MYIFSNKKGFSTGMIIGLVAVLIIGGAFYFGGRDSGMNDSEKMGDGAMMKGDIEAVLAGAQSITLADVSSSGATGTAWLAVYDGKTYHRVIAQGMPNLANDDFYEGWLVKNAATGDFFSTGKLAYNPATKEATLDFVVDGDKSDYRFVVITSEPNDGNPQPDKHIIEERFPADIDLYIAGDAMMPSGAEAMEDKDDDVMVDDGAMSSDTKAMEGKVAYQGTLLAGTKEAPLLDFVKSDYDSAIKSNALVVLYFYANWCPTCKAEFPLMQSAFNQLLAGTKVIGFRVNYKDNETDANETALAKEFGVAYQHTKVFVKDGVKVLKSPESWDTEKYISEITKAL